MKRTTILAKEELLLDAKYLARQQGRSFTSLVQDALTEYVATHRPSRRLPEFVGMGHSGDGTISQRDEEILAAEIDPIEGWSPGRNARGRRADSAADRGED